MSKILFDFAEFALKPFYILVVVLVCGFRLSESVYVVFRDAHIRSETVFAARHALNVIVQKRFREVVGFVIGLRGFHERVVDRFSRFFEFVQSLDLAVLAVNLFVCGLAVGVYRLVFVLLTLEEYFVVEIDGVFRVGHFVAFDSVRGRYFQKFVVSERICELDGFFTVTLGGAVAIASNRKLFLYVAFRFLFDFFEVVVCEFVGVDIHIPVLRLFLARFYKEIIFVKSVRRLIHSVQAVEARFAVKTFFSPLFVASVESYADFVLLAAVGVD